jgi:hypothetical protein
MYYADSEVRDVLYFGVVLFINIYFHFSCLYLLRSCVYVMQFCCIAYFPYAYGVLFGVLLS